MRRHKGAPMESYQDNKPLKGPRQCARHKKTGSTPVLELSFSR
jgi:hypothetical protein